MNGQPQLYGSLGTHMKLNGYYDAFGGLQNYDTFNVGFIDVLVRTTPIVLKWTCIKRK